MPQVRDEEITNRQDVPGLHEENEEEVEAQLTLNPPEAVRKVLYVITGVGGPVVAYLLAKEIIGTLEVALWSAEVAVVSAMAAFNVQSGKNNP